MAKKNKGSRKANGQFKKGHSTAVAHAPRTITKTKRVYVAKKSAPKKKHRRKGGDGGGTLSNTLVPLALGGVALGYLTSDRPADSLPGKILGYANMVPGAKTFGPELIVGGAALLIDRKMYRNKYIRWFGYVGIGVGAIKLGRALASDAGFKWLGDEEDGDGDFVADVE